MFCGAFFTAWMKDHCPPTNVISNWHPRDFAAVQENEDGQMVEAKVPCKDFRFGVCEFPGSSRSQLQVPPSLCLHIHWTQMCATQKCLPDRSLL